MIKAKTLTVLTPAKLVVGNNGGRTITSVQPLKGQGKFHLFAKSDAGTSPTLAVKIQGSTTGPGRGPVMIGVGDGETKHRTGTDTAIRLGAKFALAAARTITKVTLPLKKNGTVSSGTLTLEVQTDTAGAPSGTAVATATFSAASVAASFSPVDFTFAVPVDLSIGTYWLVLTSNVTLHATNNIGWRSSTVAEAGNAAVFDEAWAAVATKDLDFRTEVYAFADIPGLAFTGVTTTGAIETKEANLDAYSAVRAHITVGGTDTPAFYAGVAVQGREGYQTT